MGLSVGRLIKFNLPPIGGFELADLDGAKLREKFLTVKISGLVQYIKYIKDPTISLNIVGSRRGLGLANFNSL